MLQAMNSLSGKLNNPIEQIYPELEDLEINPSMEQQNFKSKKYGYNNVTVKAVESEELSIMPSATEQVKEGIFNKVTVAGDNNLLPENIKNGVEIFGVQGNAKVSDIKITNANYLFYQNNRLDIINELLTLCKGITEVDQMFGYCSNLKSVNLSNFDASNIKSMYRMFYNCTNLTNLDLSSFNTSNLNETTYMFNTCTKLTNLDLSSFDMGKVRAIENMFYNCNNLTEFKSFKNLGKGYSAKNNNISNYKLNLSSCSLLTHESLMSVINNLYDLNLTYDVANGGTLYTQSLTLGATNLAKLTAEEIAIATNKRLDGFIERRTKMQFFDYTKPKMMVAEKGKHIRAKNDVYVAEHIDENGLLVEEHVPYYSTTLFVPDTFTEEQMNELYVEENIT